jgi:hypothetical protein
LSVAIGSLDPAVHSFVIQRRGDGALVVRVRCGQSSARLPDAVFSFHAGDPQYAFWEDQFSRQQSNASAS